MLCENQRRRIPMGYLWYDELKRKSLARVAKSFILTGDVRDYFLLPGEEKEDDEYVRLADFLIAKWTHPEIVVVHYTAKRRMRFIGKDDEETIKRKVREAWSKVEGDRVEDFDNFLRKTQDNPAVALELMNQICMVARSKDSRGKPLLSENFIMLIEGVDFILPHAQMSRFTTLHERCITICEEWFSDPDFMNGRDTVVFITESRSQLHDKIQRLIQLYEIQVPSPDAQAREHYIRWFDAEQPAENKIKLDTTIEKLVALTAGLTLLDLRQLLHDCCFDEKVLSAEDVIRKVERFIEQQVGEGVVECKHPSHRLSDIVGNTDLRKFLGEELIPRLDSGREIAVSGITVCGPIGSGKTYIFEAVAAELGMVVLVLKNLRSKWFGETDIIFERLQRIVGSLDKVLIFVDEADTQFGQLSEGAHETEQRLTGKIQAMMSDPMLRGKVYWLLMTARVHRLSPDILREGRCGAYIIPVLDPVGKDLSDFLDWALAPATDNALSEDDKFNLLEQIAKMKGGYSADNFASMRARLKAARRRNNNEPLTLAQIKEVLANYLRLDQSAVRTLQDLLAKVHCTWLPLIAPYIDGNLVETAKETWWTEIRDMNRVGII